MAGKDVSRRTVVDCVEDWFGEELSHSLIARARALTADELVAYYHYVETQSDEMAFPGRALHHPRPLAESGYDLKGLMLLCDEVAVPNVALPRPLNYEPWDFAEPEDYGQIECIADRSHRQDLVEGLEQLWRLKPLISSGAVLVLPLSREEYENRAIRLIDADPVLYSLASKLFPKSEQDEITAWRQELAREAGRSSPKHVKTDWIRFAAGLGLTPLLNILIAALIAIDIESDPSLEVNVLTSASPAIAAIAGVADRVAASYTADGPERDRLEIEVLTDLLGRATAVRLARLDVMRAVLGLAIPRLDKLTYRDLARARDNQPEFSMFRLSLKHGLSEAASAPFTVDWPDYARGALAEEMVPARDRLEAAIRKSRFLTDAMTGVRSLAVSAVGAAAGWMTGGDVMTALAGSGATGGASTLLAMLVRLRDRRGAHAMLAHYLGFTDMQGEASSQSYEPMSRMSISRIDLLP